MIRRISLVLVLMVLLGLPFGRPADADGENTEAPIVNVPYFGPTFVDKFSEAAIFWFGRITPTENFTDVRIAYYGSELWVYVAVFDRRLWYDETPSASDLTNWDAVTLYLSTTGNVGEVPGSNAYRFISQSRPAPTHDSRYILAQRGNGTTWETASIAFTTKPGWRGDSWNNHRDDRGWAMTFRIPFASLGVSSTPHGQTWGIALEVHDRDNAAGTPIPDKVYPDGMAPDRPVTWARLHFGLPKYLPGPTAVHSQAVVYHRDANNSEVPDGGVGGYANCGDGMDFWTEWGERVYYTFPSGEEYGDFNIQNQSDLADWPCFSKYYITFPLPAQPPGTVIRSATLTLYLWGGAGAPEERTPSLIQVFTVRDDWTEPTLNWNNAPLAYENVSQCWVQPILEPVNWPGVRYDWNIGYAVAKAYAAGETHLRLAVYSADSNYHSGKYFVSSDTGDWNAQGRPRLTIVFGRPLNSFRALSIGDQDGWLLENQENGNAAGSLNAGAVTLRLGDDSDNRQYRAVLSFDTSGLPDHARVVNVKLRIKRSAVIGNGDPVSLLGGFMVDLRRGAFSNNRSLQLTDWRGGAHQIIGPLRPDLTSDWYTLDLSSARSHINLTGLTQIRLRFRLDDNNNRLANILSLFSGNASEDNRPRLIVEYEVP